MEKHQWVSYLTRLSRQHGGMSALIHHDFESRSGDVVEACEHVPRRYLRRYAVVSKIHPWAQYLWRDPAGTPIFPDERRVYDRVSQDRNTDLFVNTLIRLGIPIGMGAILWKDRHPNPRHVFAIAILRPGDPKKGDAFTREEKDLFARQIPALVKDIQTHDRVRSLRGDMTDFKR